MTWAVFDDSHLTAIGELLLTGTERVTAVIGGALLEEAVERTLVERLRDAPKIIEAQFNPEKPLGSIGPQIELLYLLYAIDDSTRQTLKAIAAIRNFFAHNPAVSFASDKIRKSVGQLELHKDKTHYPNPRIGGDSDEGIEEIKDHKTLFLVNLKLGLLGLMRDRVSHKLHTNEMLSPEEIRSQFPEGRVANVAST
jgi:hypothetical protein